MIKKFFGLTFPFIITGVFVFGHSQESQNPPLPEKGEAILRVMMQDLASEHYEPLPINNEFSERVYNLYLDDLDPTKRFLLQSDVAELEKYKTKIDNQILDVSFEFLNLSVKIIDARVAEAKTYYTQILEQPFDFTKDESMELDPKKLGYVPTKEALKTRWYQSLKYQTMVRLADMMEEQEKALEKGDKTYKTKTIEEMEAEARQKVLKTQDSWFNRMAKITPDDRLAAYLNSITSAYDPHSNYFPPKAKEDFDISLSGRLEGIGATLQEKDGYIKVISIVPGSPSARQGELQVDDVILKVAQGADEPVDVVDMRLDDAVQLIRGKKGTEVRLTIKKVDGTVKVISIIRDVVMIEEGYAKSALVKDTQLATTTGYINLPKFYADFNHQDGRNCADDVAKEISKLKAEGVNGIILDLRDNGGGSLRDVVDMAGLFVDNGPIVQVKSRDEVPYVYEDRDPQTHYNGPLVILVNQFSASASEIMAAAMQDYGRAVIVGSKATYGKGTVQRFTNLDALVADNALRPMGSLKLTIQKFYRINGHTTQLNGVIPDIMLPDKYAQIEVGEKEQQYAMPFDQIAAAKYKPWQSSNPFNIEKIKSQSHQRIDNNPTFQLIEQQAAYLKEQRDNTTETLNLAKYRAEQKQNEAQNKKFNDITGAIPELAAQSLQSDISEMAGDTAKLARAKDFTAKLSKDVYLLEAVSIINDMNTR
ncbi:tail-specific protease [Sphingobacteriales bacterium UPWRP_1]|nr:tail-specific protease [Sphingobacteriales bacterium TSM_CSM]PSJ78062.1 tail-specific protease [Sphingobacteriales bacterium UPWRP_1]